MWSPPVGFTALGIVFGLAVYGRFRDVGFDVTLGTLPGARAHTGALQWALGVIES